MLLKSEMVVPVMPGALGVFDMSQKWYIPSRGPGRNAEAPTCAKFLERFRGRMFHGFPDRDQCTRESMTAPNTAHLVATWFARDATTCRAL